MEQATTISNETATNDATTSDNDTKMKAYIDLKNNPMDVIFFVLITSLLIVSLYVLLVLMLYVYRFLRLRRRARASISSGQINGFGRIALAMRFVSVGIAAFCLTHFIAEQVGAFF